MDPLLGRIAFGLGVIVFVLALIPLPFVDRESPEFVATVLALVFSLLFLILLSIRIYLSARRRKGGSND